MKKMIVTASVVLGLNLGGIILPDNTGLTVLAAETPPVDTAAAFKNHAENIITDPVGVGGKKSLFVTGEVKKGSNIYWVQLWVNEKLITTERVIEDVPKEDNYFFELDIKNSIQSMEDSVTVLGLERDKKVVVEESEVFLQESEWILTPDAFTLKKDSVVTGLADWEITDVKLAVNTAIVDEKEVPYTSLFSLDTNDEIQFLRDYVEVLGFDVEGELVQKAKVAVNPIKLVTNLNDFSLGERNITGTVNGGGAAQARLYVNNKRQQTTIVKSDGTFSLIARAITSIADKASIAILNAEGIEIGRFNVVINESGQSRPFIGQYSDGLSAAPGGNVGFQTSFRNYGFENEYNMGIETIPTAKWLKPEFYFYYQKDMEIVAFTMGLDPIISINDLDPSKVVVSNLENRTFDGTEYKGLKLSFQYDFQIRSVFGETFLSAWLKTPEQKTNDLSVIAFGSSDSNATNYKPIVHAGKDTRDLTQTGNPNKRIFEVKKTNYSVSY